MSSYNSLNHLDINNNMNIFLCHVRWANCIPNNNETTPTFASTHRATAKEIIKDTIPTAQSTTTIGIYL